MTRDDIIRMAREAWTTEKIGVLQFYRIELEAFANLVAAQEREACARVCEGDGVRQVTGDECAVAIRARGERD